MPRRAGATSSPDARASSDRNRHAVSMEAELPDGTRVLFRPIRPEDRQRLAAGMTRLSPESRYRRFFRHMDRLTEKQLTYLTEVDGTTHFALIATLPESP